MSAFPKFAGMGIKALEALIAAGGPEVAEATAELAKRAARGAGRTARRGKFDTEAASLLGDAEYGSKRWKANRKVREARATGVPITKKIGRKISTGFKKHPVGFLLGAAGATPLATDILDPLVFDPAARLGKMAMRENPFSTQMASNNEMRLRQAKKLKELKELRRVAASNVQRLQQYAPELVEQLMYGLEVPQGGVVIGGGGGNDRLTEMAMRMAQGEFQQPDPLAALLQGNN